MTYLIVGRNKFSDCVDNASPCELAWPCSRLKAQLLLLLLLCQPTLLFCFFFLLHDPPDITRDGPMVYRYICLFTVFNIKFIMLTNVHETRRISSLMKSLTLPMCFDIALVSSG